MKHRLLLWSLPLVGLGLLAAGCTSEPAGYHQGRVPVSGTTDAEINNDLIFPAALIEASDQFAQQFAQDLSTMPIVAQTNGPITVIVGDVNNKTGIVGSSDFEMLAARLRNSLLQSKYVTDKVHFVESRARMQNLAAREGVGENPVAAGPPQYDPATTYALNLDVYRVGRVSSEGDTNYYYIEAELVNFKTNQIVEAPRRYEIKQWHP